MDWNVWLLLQKVEVVLESHDLRSAYLKELEDMMIDKQLMSNVKEEGEKVRWV